METIVGYLLLCVQILLSPMEAARYLGSFPGFFEFLAALLLVKLFPSKCKSLAFSWGILLVLSSLARFAFYGVWFPDATSPIFIWISGAVCGLILIATHKIQPKFIPYLCCALMAWTMKTSFSEAYFVQHFEGAYKFGEVQTKEGFVTGQQVLVTLDADPTYTHGFVSDILAAKLDPQGGRIKVKAVSVYEWGAFRMFWLAPEGELRNSSADIDARLHVGQWHLSPKYYFGPGLSLDEAQER